jgi:hypothetical protein
LGNTPSKGLLLSAGLSFGVEVGAASG